MVAFSILVAVHILVIVPRLGKEDNKPCKQICLDSLLQVENGGKGSRSWAGQLYPLAFISHSKELVCSVVGEILGFQFLYIQFLSVIGIVQFS